MTPDNCKYVIISPVRDEEEFIAATIESVIRQTIKPMKWIIVDDGSGDRTGYIIDHYAQEYSWIQALHRSDRGFRTTGGGIEGFLEGYRSLRCQDWEYLVNLDGDVTFDADYFERCFQYFQTMPRLGIGGGTIYHKVREKLRLERCSFFHVRGATKIYRRQCWEALGELVHGLGWDTVDEIKANMRGWVTQSFPDVPLIHHRFTGTSYGMWQGPVKDGTADYVVGYHPIFFAGKCLRWLFKRPYLIGAIGMCYGFVRCYFQKISRVVDQDVIHYVRRQQLRRFFGMDSIWK